MMQATDSLSFAFCILLLIFSCISERTLPHPQGSKKAETSCLWKVVWWKQNEVYDKKSDLPLSSDSQRFEHPSDDQTGVKQEASPEAYASFLSRVMYVWYTKIIFRGYRKPIMLNDLYQLNEKDTAQYVSRVFSINLDRFVVPKKPLNYYKERRRLSILNPAHSTGYADNTCNMYRSNSTQIIHELDNSIDKLHSNNSKAISGKGAFLRRTSDNVLVKAFERSKESKIFMDSSKPLEKVSAKNVEVGRDDDFQPTDENCEVEETDSTLCDKEIDSIPSVAFSADQAKPSKQRSVKILLDPKPNVILEQVADHGDVMDVQLEPGDQSNRTNRSSLSKGSISFEVHKPRKGFDHKKIDTTTPACCVGHNEHNKGVDKESNKNDPSSSQKESHFLSLFLAMLKTYGCKLLWSAFLKLIHDTLIFLNPILLKYLLDFLKADANEPTWHGFLYAVAMLLAACLNTFILQRYFFHLNVIGMHIRTAITCAIYKKTLWLSNQARRESTTGQIINLISSDAQQFVFLLPYVNIIWSGPFQIVVALAMLWNELGVATLAGLAVLLLLLPINMIIAKLTKKMQEKKSRTSDSRIKLISELLSGMRVVKLYAWEPSFSNEIGALRDQEVRYLSKVTYLRCISFIWNCAPALVALSSFGVYVFISEKNILDAQKAFVSMSLFNILRFPLFMFPTVVTNVMQVYVAMKRLGKFLQHVELDPDLVSRGDTPGISAVIERGVFGWDPKEEPVLSNISLHFPEGQLTSIMGLVGSGKSSLLHALLGNMERFDGRVNVKGSVAYVPQQPWIFNATLRENILFLTPFDPERYRVIVEACNLGPDLAILPNGDLSEIGDKGINLSGGQKQRVSLARACYSNADIYLLDDPLSAVDSHVGLHLLHHVLSRSGGLLATKTCILVTHNPKALPFSERVALLVQGQLSELGTYRQLIQSPTSQLARFLLEHVHNGQEFKESNPQSHSLTSVERRQSAEISQEEPPVLGRKSSVRGSSRSNHNAGRIRTVSHSSSIIQDIEVASVLDVDPTALLEKEVSTEFEHFIDEEEQKSLPDHSSNSKNVAPDVAKDASSNRQMQSETVQEGRVKLAIFKIYFKNMGLLFGALVIILYPLSAVSSYGSTLWLSEWSEDVNTQRNLTNQLYNNPDIFDNPSAYPELQEQLQNFYQLRDYRLGIYGVLTLVQVILTFAAAVLFSYGHLQCVKRLHSQLLNGVLHAPARFFDTIPQGRIVNRFSQDILMLDDPLLVTMRSAMNCFCSCFLTLVVSCTVNPWIIIPLVLLMALYGFIQKVYVTTSRQMKRIEAVSRSPLLSHFTESIQGVESIRAYGLTEKYKDITANRLDVLNSVSYASMMAQRWLAVLLELIGNLVTFCVAIFSVAGRGTLSAGYAGLVISYALNLSQTLNWLVRMMAELESEIVCVERIHEYSNIKQEAPWQIPSNQPPTNWPDGQIEFNNYGARYSETLDLVLRSINFSVKKGEKLGIVGRTGSGKSSLVLGLFRLLEASEGKIFIDGIDISQIGLHDVRGRLTLIPQDPVLFCGTLRFNLDPFSSYSDKELWRALELSNLKSYVIESGESAGLNMTISEGGSNLSMGQRQLVCLARALLRRTSILVLDEATAAVDPITDQLIQDTIRKEFAHCTVLTIAHRLNTILDYDRVMVLHQGDLCELDTPSNLLKNHNSMFYALAKDANLV